ncbi:MAG: thioredoxin family protein [Gemmatimonadota bacterium]
MDRTFNYERAYTMGCTFDPFLEAAKAHRELWHAVAARTSPPPEEVDRLRKLPGRWRLLAIADDWCGDAVDVLPVAARLAESSHGVEFRIVGREVWPELMDRHLTGGSRSVPVIILLDEAGRCRGWWGPRPSELQAWFESEGRSLPKEERFRLTRRWHARNRGATVARELVDLVACAALPGEVGCDGTRRRCAEGVAA